MNQRKNKLFLTTGFVIGVLASLLFLWSCDNWEEHSGHEHMNHDVHSMSGHEIGNIDSVDLGRISLATEYNVISSQRTVNPVWSKGNSNTFLNGYISVDERRDNKVSVRLSGRVEKLYVKYDFQYVKKGEKIIEIYGPELNTIQEELLFLMKSGSEAELAKKAEEKLILMGISDTELKEIKNNGSPLQTVSILSPYSGYVYFENTSSTEMPEKQLPPIIGMAMTSRPMAMVERMNGGLQIREGSYVNQGQTLFKVNDLKEVYGIILIDNKYTDEISEAMHVDLTSELAQDSIIRTKISFLEPILRNGQRFLAARIYLKNESGLLKINSLFRAKINLPNEKRLLIPGSSILSLGTRNIVWIKTAEAGKGKYIFQAREIATGVAHNNMTEVISGLTDKDEIAFDAGYMIDREGIVQVK